MSYSISCHTQNSKSHIIIGLLVYDIKQYSTQHQLILQLCKDLGLQQSSVKIKQDQTGLRVLRVLLWINDHFATR